MILDTVLEEYRKSNNLTVNELLTCDTMIKLLRLFGENDTSVNNIIKSVKTEELYKTLQEHLEDKKKNLIQVLYENHPVSNEIGRAHV